MAGQSAEQLTSMSGLPKDHFRVHVSYEGLPSFDDLEKEWGENNATVIFDGRRITLHESCQDMDRTPGERTFYVHDAGGDWDSEEQIAWGLKQRNVTAPNGYRPATHDEVYEFAKAHPELANFVGFGSFVRNISSYYVACVWRNTDSRHFGFGWWGDCGWNRGMQVLFVSK